MANKRMIVVMVGLMIIFAIIFFLAFISLQRKESLFGIGIPVEFENYLIMFLCIGSIARIVWELYKN
ncbi:TPA: hypothetical protein HA235_02330 [Candidatus Woesearchaeota archaeon]|nr:hypothetical protein [Candidatus Woesearchaeota archaeon]HIH31521.1 hypothetical protein [Candidatus Woesearchaeota archaeon]HIH54322.1 hypothetical protein [Candidatus Woesearchaeota archaeon]HIJ02489.1 hypothetical protein [Candidatus Woesearchaeota archaeon]HIJ13465.1 hypothetical protein [Candidatus Woesearchaeota archaeon]